MIGRGLAFLGRKAMPLLASGLAIGLAVPEAAALVRPALTPLVFLLTLATMLRVDWPNVARHARRPASVLLFALWSLVVLPVVMAAILRIVAIPDGLRQSLVLWAAASPLASAPAIAILLGLDGALALVGAMAGTLLVPLTLPPLLLGLLGLELRIGLGELMLRLVLFVGGVFVAAALIRRVAGPGRLERLAMEISGFNVLVLVLFGIGAMDGVRGLIAARPADAALFVAAAYAAMVFFLALSALVFFRLGRRQALTVGIIGGNKNMALAWATLGAAAPPDFGLFFAAAQLPIYTLPLLLRPLLRRLGAAAPPAPETPALTVAESKR